MSHQHFWFAIDYCRDAFHVTPVSSESSMVYWEVRGILEKDRNDPTAWSRTSKVIYLRTQNCQLTLTSKNEMFELTFHEPTGKTCVLHSNIKWKCLLYRQSRTTTVHQSVGVPPWTKVGDGSVERRLAAGQLEESLPTIVCWPIVSFSEFPAHSRISNPKSCETEHAFLQDAGHSAAVWRPLHR